MVQAEQADAQHAGDSCEAEDWRHKLHHYLDQLFQKDQTAGADYHSLQVALCLALLTLTYPHLSLHSRIRLEHQHCTSLMHMSIATSRLHIITVAQ